MGYAIDVNLAKQTLLRAYLILIGYIPFHAVISTFIISSVGGDFIVKGFKDGLLFTLFLATLTLILTKFKKVFFKQHYIFSTFIVLFVLSIMAAGVLGGGSEKQTLAGAILLYRYIWIFYLGIMLIALTNNQRFKENALKLTLVTSFIVVGFGFLQFFVLPKDFLTVFGYSAETIRPYQTIDNNESFIRILSTLRGPNPLGAYLAMIAPLAIYYIRKINKNKLLVGLIYAVMFITTIFASQSRSAWVGLIVGLLVYGYLTMKNKKIIYLTAAAILPFLAIGYIARNSSFIQNTVFHRDPNEISNINSDDQRISSLKYSISKIKDKPFGHGLGSSGPASNYGNNPVIIENYYLDIAYQIGWIGLVAYLGIIGSVGYLLLKLKTSMSYALFSGLVAISVIALFWPVWTDETVALTWWGMAGLVLSSDIVQKSKKR